MKFCLLSKFVPILLSKIFALNNILKLQSYLNLIFSFFERCQWNFMLCAILLYGVYCIFLIYKLFIFLKAQKLEL